jgi:hypothetical protein
MQCHPVFTVTNGQRYLHGVTFCKPIKVSPQLAGAARLLLKLTEPSKLSSELDGLNEPSLKFTQLIKPGLVSYDENPETESTAPCRNIKRKRGVHFYAVRTLSLSDKLDVFAFPYRSVRAKWLEEQKGFIAFPIPFAEAGKLIHFQSATVVIGEDERYKLTVRKDASERHGEIFSIKGEIIHGAVV